MLKPPNDDRGQQHQRFTVRFRDEVGHDREFGKLELHIAHHSFESTGGDLHIGER
jgi:hypothetical protein